MGRSNKKKRSLPSQRSSEASGIGGEGGIVPAPTPSSSNDGQIIRREENVKEGGDIQYGTSQLREDNFMYEWREEREEYRKKREAEEDEYRRREYGTPEPYYSSSSEEEDVDDYEIRGSFTPKNRSALIRKYTPVYQERMRGQSMEQIEEDIWTLWSFCIDDVNGMSMLQRKGQQKTRNRLAMDMMDHLQILAIYLQIYMVRHHYPKNRIEIGTDPWIPETCTRGTITEDNMEDKNMEVEEQTPVQRCDRATNTEVMIIKKDRGCSPIEWKKPPGQMEKEEFAPPVWARELIEDMKDLKCAMQEERERNFQFRKLLKEEREREPLRPQGREEDRNVRKEDEEDEGTDEGADIQVALAPLDILRRKKKKRTGRGKAAVNGGANNTATGSDSAVSVSNTEEGGREHGVEKSWAQVVGRRGRGRLRKEEVVSEIGACGEPTRVGVGSGNKELRCYRCLCVGHMWRWCTSGVDRSSRCYNCGTPGHVARNCSAGPCCPLCVDLRRPTGHSLGGDGCYRGPLGGTGISVRGPGGIPSTKRPRWRPPDTCDGVSSCPAGVGQEGNRGGPRGAFSA